MKKEILNSYSDAIREGIHQLRNLNDNERAVLNALDILRVKLEELVDAVRYHAGYQEMEVVPINNVEKSRKPEPMFKCDRCEQNFSTREMCVKGDRLYCSGCLKAIKFGGGQKNA